MMKLAILILSLITISQSQDWPCTKQQAGAAFKLKSLDNPPSLEPSDPYKTCDSTCRAKIDSFLLNKVSICAYKYTSSDKTTYSLKTFDSLQLA